MTYPVISLFSGAMGLDLGLAEAGLHIRIAQDVNGKYYQKEFGLVADGTEQYNE